MKRALVISVTALLSLAPAAHAREEGGASTVKTSPDAEKAPYDVQFLDTMVQHHRDGIKMFQMAVDKAQSRALRDKARQMMDDQKKEIPELQSMRGDIQSDAPEAVNENLPGMKAMDMRKLEASKGRDFDRHFIDMTIEHHQGAIDMARSELKSGRSRDVKGKAQEMIEKQGKEIAELKRMR